MTSVAGNINYECTIVHVNSENKLKKEFWKKMVLESCIFTKPPFDDWKMLNRPLKRNINLKFHLVCNELENNIVNNIE